MPIDFQCPHCHTASVVPDEFAGQSGPCRGCNQTILIPGTPVNVNPFSAPMANASYPQPGYPPMPRKSDAGTRMLLPVDRSILAIAAGYFGLFSLIVFPAPIALVLGILAVRDIKKSNGRKHGLGRAWFAIIIGGLFSLVLLAAIVLPIIGPMFAPER